jgi:hypothetical protein
MTILTAIKSAVLRTTGAVVNNVYGSTEQIAVEMADLVNEVATDIAASHDWRALTKVATVTGTGVENYALPADYDRMLLNAEIDDAATRFWGYEPFLNVNDWMRFKSGGGGLLSPGGWIILGGELQFYPAPSGVAQYPYISNQWGRSDLDVAQSGFLADTDTFVLPERLLTLGLIWRWQSQKGMDYSEDMATYEMVLAQAQARDKGARVLRTPTRYFRGNTAYTNRALG